MKLRIQFVHSEEILGELEDREDRFVLCAKAGLLEEPLNATTMCHIVRNTEWGAEMRSVFWLGHIARREGDEEVFSIEGLIGNTAIARYLALPEAGGIDLMTHAIEEMGYLADFLPALHASESNGSAETEL